MDRRLLMPPFATRRDFLYGLGSALGSVAFTAMLRAEQAKSGAAPGPLAPKPQHHPAKARNCIFLFMEGGPSHIDTFDPKPKLKDLHLKEFTRDDKFASAMASGKRYFVRSPFAFRPCGKSGIWMSEHFRAMENVADELCVYRGCTVDSVNHPSACYQMNTGNRFGGDPGIGAWVSYGLGTFNQDLPAFVVLPELSYPQGGSANWSNGYLPVSHQGTALRAAGSPILDLNPPPHVTPEMQRANLDLIAKLNDQHAKLHPDHAELSARMESYELAYRMQANVPDLIDLNKEDAATREMYGIGGGHSDEFGRKCLLARRLVEKGVRFVQVWSGGWDSHDFIERAHAKRIQSIDKPVAGLIADLKARGMLENTLVVICGEFGRSPDNGVRAGGVAYGRDHNNHAMSIVLAGGGVPAGKTVGATDETGAKAVENVHPIKDFHVTLLHLLGLEDHKLTFFHGGRFKQLSQTGGEVIKELIA